MIYILSVLAIIVLWELGGQYNKAFRRYGIPVVVLALVLWRTLHGGIWWTYLPLLGVAPELFLGYGQGSFAARYFREEVGIRLVYAILLAIPLCITGALNDSELVILVPLMLIAAFQIRAGAWFKLPGTKKHFLIEDFFRSLTFGIGLCLVI